MKENKKKIVKKNRSLAEKVKDVDVIKKLIDENKKKSKSINKEKAEGLIEKSIDMSGKNPDPMFSISIDNKGKAVTKIIDFDYGTIVKDNINKKNKPPVVNVDDKVLDKMLNKEKKNVKLPKRAQLVDSKLVENNIDSVLRGKNKNNDSEKRIEALETNLIAKELQQFWRTEPDVKDYF